MSYKPTTGVNINDNDFKLVTSEAVYEGLKLKVNAPASAGTASQILSLVNPTTGETSWIDNTGAGANTSLSNLSATAINAVLRGLDGDATAPAYSFTGDTNTGMWSSGADTLNFSTGGAERTRITTNGDVLIGLNFTAARSNFNNSVTRPKLQIEGADNNQSAISITDNGNAATISPCIYFGKSRGGTIGSNTIVQNGDQIGALRFQGNNGTNMISSSIVRCAIDGTPSATSMPSRLEFFTTPDGTTTVTERMRIASNGNVGIGTSTPTNKLDVGVTAANNNSGIEITNTDSAGYGGCLSFAHRSTSGGPVAVRSQITSEGGGTNSFMRFFTTLSDSVTEKMRLTGEGRLGIGTTSPGTKLAVNNGAGTIADILTLQNDSTNATQGRGSRIIFTGTGNSTIASVTGETSTSSNTEGAIRLTGVGASSFVAVNTNSFERMRIDAAGNVGIGTSTPTKKLEVAGAVKADEFTVTRGGGEVYRLDPHTHDEGTETTNFQINWSNGSVHSVTLNAAGPLAITMVSPVDGGAYALRIIQGATPGTVTWPASVKWPGGTPPTLSTGVGDVDVVNLLYYADTGFYYATFALDFA